MEKRLFHGPPWSSMVKILIFHLYNSVDTYLRPESTAIVSTVESGRIWDATRIAATRFAPVEVPAKIASSLASRRAIASASSVDTGSMPLASDGSHIGTT